MNTKITRATPRKRKSFAAKVAAVRESRVVLFGSPNDSDVKESIRKAEVAGRKTEVVARPSFDTGLGPCGKHVCSCKDVCKEDYAKSIGYPGDKGPTMGVCY